MSTTRTWTEAELLALPKDGMKRELVDGEIRVSPAGLPHGIVCVRLASRVLAHVETRSLGHVADSSTGCWMPSGNLRVPDLTFLSRERAPSPLPDGFLRVVPDLVAEVLSPEDSRRAILDKVGEYLEAGVRLVWVIDPKARTAVAWRSLTDARTIRENDDLDGGDVIPGFRCLLRDVLG